MFFTVGCLLYDLFNTFYIEKKSGFDKVKKKNTPKGLINNYKCIYIQIDFSSLLSCISRIYSISKA